MSVLGWLHKKLKAAWDWPYTAAEADEILAKHAAEGNRAPGDPVEPG